MEYFQDLPHGQVRQGQEQGNGQGLEHLGLAAGKAVLVLQCVLFPSLTAGLLLYLATVFFSIFMTF